MEAPNELGAAPKLCRSAHRTYMAAGIALATSSCSAISEFPFSESLRVAAMKYMMLIYTDESAWTEGERQRCYGESTELTHELHSRGQFLSASPLQPVSTATSVRMREGRRLVTDGPFAETREQLGGYFLIEAKDFNEAIAIAARIPGARKGTVEVRPVMELEGLPKVSPKSLSANH